jgi:MoaA/NifB/PqqE/SkfB family radical SAM enzyme
MPLDVQLEMANRCNLNCGSCNQLEQKREKSFLDWDTLVKIVNEAAAEGVAYFTICGLGEASLHPDLFRLLGLIRSKIVEPKGLRRFNRMLSVLISNGKWTQKQVGECIENPPDLLSISVAGLNDEEILKYRKGIDLDKLWNDISQIYNQRKITREIDQGVSPTIHVSTHVFPYEMETRLEDIKQFKQKWFNICDVIVIKPTEIYTNDPKFFINEFGSKLNKQLQYTKISASGYTRTAPCFETSRRLSINSDGDVWCGHSLSERFGSYLGNVKKQTLREIWHGKEINEFRLQVRSGIFQRSCCLKCGGEIREFHKNRSNKIEQQIIFSD